MRSIKLTLLFFIFIPLLSVAQTQYFTEGFEADTALWKFTTTSLRTGSTSKWVRNTTHHAFGSGSAKFNNADLHEVALEMKNSVNLIGASLPFLTFYHMCLLESPNQIWDWGYIEVSTDGGATWDQIPTTEYLGSGGYFPETKTVSRATPPEGPFFTVASYEDWKTATPSEQDVPPAPGGTLWKKEVFSLQNYTTNDFKLRFHISTDDFVLYWGWAIDSIRIAEPDFANDMRPTSINLPIQNSVILQNVQITPSASYRNIGNTLQTDVPIYYKVYTSAFDAIDSIYYPDSLVYQDSASITELNSGGIYQKTFTPFALSDTGQYFSVAITKNPGDQDPSNDSIVSTFFIGSVIQGTFYIGGTTPTPQFNTFKDATNFLQRSAVIGDVTLILNKPLFSEPACDLQATYVDTSAGHTVTIKPGPGLNVRMVFTGAPDNPNGIRVINTRNIIIDGSNDGSNSVNLTLEANSNLVSVTTTTVRFENVKNSVFKNTKVLGYRNQVAAIGAAVVVQAQGTGNINKDLVFDNLQIQKANYGIFLNGASASQRDLNITIRNNKFGANEPEELYAGAVYAVNVDTLLVYNNDIRVRRTTGFGGGETHGMLLNVRYSRIYNNIIREMLNTRTAQGDAAYSLYGIRVNGRTAGFESRNAIYNNMIFGFGVDAPISSQKYFGIRVSRGKFDTVAHNTVFLDGRSTFIDTSACFILDSTSAVVVNNIFYNGRQDSTIGLSMAIWKRATHASSSFLEVNYNNYYVPTPTGYVGGKSPSSLTLYRSFVDWQTGFPLDSNSVVGNPRFIKEDSLENLHIIDTVKSWAESRGRTGLGVAADIDGDPRSTIRPDAGADEFNGISYPNKDMESLSMEDPRNNGTKLTGIPFRPIVVFHNNGSKSLTNVPVRFLYKKFDFPDYINEFQGDTVISSVGVNEYKTVVFRNVTLNEAYLYNGKAEVDLSGDEDPANNTLEISFFVGSPLSGEKTVGPGGRYATLSDAIFDLRSAGLNAPVTLKLLANETDSTAVYSEPPLLFDTSIVGLSITNTITIKPDVGVNATIQISSTPTDPYGIRINKVSGIVIDGSNSIGGTTRNLTIETGGQYGIWVSGGGYGTGGFAVTKPAKYNMIKNVKVLNGAQSAQDALQFYGIYLIGRSDLTGAPKDSFNTVRNCEIVNFGQAGIYVKNNSTTILENNSIHDWTQTSSAMSIYGIYTTTGVADVTIKNNKIYNLYHQVNGGAVIGIENGGGSGSRAQVVNNMVYEIRSTGSGSSPNSTRGIYGSSAGNSDDRYYHNSVFLYGESQATSFSATNRSVCLEVVGNNMQVKNNVFVNQMTHTGDAEAGKSYTIYLGIGTNFASDYNDVWGTGTKFYVGYNNNYTGSKDRRTLVDWQNTFTPPQDTNSVSADPKFITTNDLHIKPSPERSVVESWAPPISGVTTDIDGDVRNVSLVDIGADEYTGVSAITKEFVANSVDDPVFGRLKRGRTLFSPKATLTNNGSKKQYAVPVKMRFYKSTGYEVVSSTQITVPSYTTMQINFPEVAIDSAGIYTAEFVTQLSGDNNETNDTTEMQFEVLLGIHGVITIGVDVGTLTGLLDTLAQVGVDQPLDIHLNQDLSEAAPIIIDSIQGSSAVNTVTFSSGGGAMRTLSAPGTASIPTAIKVRGASYVIFDNLKIVSTGNYGKYGIQISGISGRPATNNVVRNCIIENASSQTDFNAGYYAVYMNGYSSGSKDANNIIQNNDFTKFGQSAVRVENNNGVVIEKNSIHGWSQVTGATDIKGIWIYSNTTNAVVRANKIYSITSLVNSGSVTGIEIESNIANSNLLCYNNMIYGLLATGGGTNSNRTRGIYSIGVNQTGDKYYHNSIYLTGSDISSAQPSFSTGFEAVTSASTAFTFKNNIVFNDMTHTHSGARSYAIRLASTTVPLTVLSNNNLFWTPNNGEIIQGYVGKFGGTDLFSLANWQSGSGKDALSKSADPRYISSSNLHINTSLPRSQAGGGGESLADVTTDIDGDTRLNPPDIGADEFSVVSRISGKIFEDADGLTSTTNDRAALSGWTIMLKQNGSEIARTTSSANGSYTFSNLQDGIYVLTDSLHSTYAPLDVVFGTGAENPSRVDSGNLQMQVTDGDDAVNYNLLNYRPSTISASVLEDADGKFSTVDWIAKNWNIKLFRISQTPVTQVASVDTSSFKDMTLGAGTYVIVTADTANPKWLHLGKRLNGTTSYVGNYNSDTVVLGPASSHSVEFVNYLPHTIAVRIVDDLDGSFTFTQDDTLGKGWAVRLVSLTGSAIDTSVTNDSNLVHSYLHAGTYIVTQADSLVEDREWIHLGIIRDGIRQRKVGLNTDTVIVERGVTKTIVFVNTRIFPDTVKYRTLMPNPTEIGSGVKPGKLKRPKPGKPWVVPNFANILWAAYDKGYPKGNTFYLGKPRTDSVKTYLWIEYTKNKDLQKMFNGTHTTIGGLTIPRYGKKAPIKAPKYDAAKFNNKLAAHLAALRINISASDNGIVDDPNDDMNISFSSLVYTGTDSTFYVNSVGMSILDIAKAADSMLTYPANFSAEQYTKITEVISSANDAFYDPAPLTLADTLPGGYAYLGNVYHVKIRGTITVDEATPALFERPVQPPDRVRIPMIQRALPETYVLEQNYPNPFNPTTTIEFYLLEDAQVTLKVYNVLGQHVTTLLNNEVYDAGYDEVTFDASQLASGVYFYRLVAKSVESGNRFSSLKKMVLVK